MARQRSFEFYLRTGRQSTARTDSVEVKFNPWHDPENGRFTFAGQGNYSAGGTGADKPNTRRDLRQAGASLRSGSSGTAPGAHQRRKPDSGSESSGNRGSRASDQARFSPDNPRNYSVHVVERGETLTSIAAKRRGLRAADLAWLNGLSPDQPLQIGQRLKLPNQNYLDAGRDAKNKFMALSHYMDTHAGHLPPDVANPPSLQVQIEAEGVRTVTSNNYKFDIDVLDRPRRITGQLQLKEERRSTRNQRDAGKPDRLSHDDGGHYIAVRFNGPRERFNHFAQDRKFNRGAYRNVEDQWAALRSGKRVFVDIVPLYEWMSRRPYSLNVIWFIGDERHSESFPNETKGK